MEDKAGTLNERLLTAVKKYEDYFSDNATAIDDFKFSDLVTAVERICLQEQIDLLKKLQSDKFVYESIEKLLTDKLNTLL